jgi:hypothetical protein
VFILAEGVPGMVSSTGWREDQNHTPLAQSAGDELYVLGQDGGEGGLDQLSELSLLLRSSSSLLCFSYKTKYTNSNFSPVS